MNTKGEKAIEAAGWRTGDAADFLELSEPERQLLDLRSAISRTVRERRRAINMTQAELAGLLKTSQPRVVKIEVGGGDVSLDVMFRALVSVGGSLEDLITIITPESTGSVGRSRKSKDSTSGHDPLASSRHQLEAAPEKAKRAGVGGKQGVSRSKAGPHSSKKRSGAKS